MTNNEKAIVMAYTGVCMLCGDDFQIFHKYVENIMGRPVYTHELADKAVEDEIKEKAKADFMALCVDEEPYKAEEDNVLDKIKAEIEALPKTYPFVNHIDMYVKEDDVKKIINKYRAGKE